MNHAMNHDDHAKKHHCRRYAGMIMTMFRHDHGMIMARSWHGSHVFPTQVTIDDRNFYFTKIEEFRLIF